MWYKAPNEHLINLDLISGIKKEGDNPYLVFYKQLTGLNGSQQYFKIEFTNTQSRDVEYNKIFGALKLNKVGVIV